MSRFLVALAVALIVCAVLTDEPVLLLVALIVAVLAAGVVAVTMGATFGACEWCHRIVACLIVRTPDEAPHTYRAVYVCPPCHRRGRAT